MAPKTKKKRRTKLKPPKEINITRPLRRQSAETTDALASPTIGQRTPRGSSVASVGSQRGGGEGELQLEIVGSIPEQLVQPQLLFAEGQPHDDRHVVTQDDADDLDFLNVVQVPLADHSQPNRGTPGDNDASVVIDITDVGDQVARDRHFHRSLSTNEQSVSSFRTDSSVILPIEAGTAKTPNDEDANFWEIPSRWFSNDSPLFRGSNVPAPLPVPAAYNVSELGRENAPFRDIPVADDPYDEREQNYHYEDDLFSDDVSTMGDTPTIVIISPKIKKKLMKIFRTCWMSTLFMVVLVVSMKGYRNGWWDNPGFYGGSRVKSLFAPRRSKRYLPMRDKLIVISGEEVFQDETSPQHRALVFLSDTDPLALDPQDPLVHTQLVQRYVLSLLYFATSGAMWEHRTYWLTGQHECGWIYVLCADVKNLSNSTHAEKGSGEIESEEEKEEYFDVLDADLGMGTGKIVTGLKLYDNNMQGTIPQELGALEFLHLIDFGANRLEGTLPAPLFQRLKHLHELYLNSNYFEKTIPPDFTNGLAKLKVLTLGSNQLTGTISEEFLNNLASVERLSLENNMLSGSVPDAFRNLNQLQEIRLGQNRLTSTIPASLFDKGIKRSLQEGGSVRTSSLTKCDLHGNLLTGKLPQSLSSGVPSLKYLYLHDNLLSGSLTPTLFCGAAQNLIDVRLNNNTFTGEIKINCVMESLELLSLAHNGFSGSIHSGIGFKLPRLREIHLFENKLTSTIPSSLFQPTNLTAMLLYNNQLTGKLTANMVSGASRLVHLYLNDNNLSGTLDDFASVCGLDALTKLRLEYNSFSGTIPDFTTMPSIELLYLYNNSFTGGLNANNLPSKLKKFKVSNNSLTDEIPSQLGELTSLEVLSLNDNQLKGIIPTELGNLKSLQIVHLQRNSLSASIPSQLQKLTSLSELRLDFNEISGSIPDELCNLRDLGLETLVSDCGGEKPKVACGCCTGCS